MSSGTRRVGSRIWGRSAIDRRCIKQRSPHEHTFVAGYTNGYIYYAPTAEQLLNVGGAQEDSDCILAPEWQELFEGKVSEMLEQL